MCCHAFFLTGFPLELEPALASGISQGLDPAVIQEPTAIKYDRTDPCLLGPLGHQLAYYLGCLDVAARL
jgi:hypothetical protein